MEIESIDALMYVRPDILQSLVYESTEFEDAMNCITYYSVHDDRQRDSVGIKLNAIVTML